jgi:hypothetical protein
LKVEVNQFIKKSINFEQKWGFSQFAFALTTIIKPVKEEAGTPPAPALNLCSRFQTLPVMTRRQNSAHCFVVIKGKYAVKFLQFNTSQKSPVEGTYLMGWNA